MRTVLGHGVFIQEQPERSKLDVDLEFIMCWPRPGKLKQGLDREQCLVMPRNIFGQKDGIAVGIIEQRIDIMTLDIVVAAQ